MTVIDGKTKTKTNQTKATSKFLFSQPDNAVLYDTELCKTAYQLYNILVEMADKRTHQVTVYVRVLAQRLGRGIKTTSRHLTTLDKLGIIKRILRKSKITPKWNLASTFIIIGRHAKRYEHSEYAGDYPNDKNPKMRVPTPKNEAAKNPERESLRESLESNLKGGVPPSENSLESENPNTPVASASTKKPEKTKTPNQGSKYDLSGLPEAMRPIAEHLLMKTNRPALRDSERQILIELDKHHTTARLLKEIERCCKRFVDEGRDIQQLTFNYIGAILANQDSRTPKSGTCAGNVNGENSALGNEIVQETLSEVVSEIMPIDEAERVISEYTPAVKKMEGIPAALEELYDKIEIIEQEKTEAFLDSLPVAEDGFPDMDAAEKDANGYPIMPAITMAQYLRLKFPEAEEEELRTDSVKDKRGLEEALRIDRTCALCCSCDGSCSLGENGKRPKCGRPVVMLKKNANSRSNKREIQIGYTAYIQCKHDKHKPDPAYESRVKRSGLSETQSKQIFANYEHNGMSAEVVSAKAKAVLAAKNKTSLILAGKPGTGKTHLAIAIALDVMRGGKQALFRSVPEMLEELRLSWQNRDFASVMRKFKDVPCLVLDDLGKERTTQAGMDYLYQIIDYRYKHRMQTIVTTNALDMNGLVNKWNADKVEPLVSRILENGEWVTIQNTKNYRLSKKPVKQSEPEAVMSEPEPENTTENVIEAVEEPITTNEPEVEDRVEEPQFMPEAVQSKEDVNSINELPVEEADVEKVPEREKCHTLGDIVAYRLKYGEMPPEYQELGVYDRQSVNMTLMRDMKRETPKPEKTDEPIEMPETVEESEYAGYEDELEEMKRLKEKTEPDEQEDIWKLPEW